MPESRTKRILVLGDLSSSHDRKWLETLTRSSNLFLITRKSLDVTKSMAQWLNEYNIFYLGSVLDYSVIRPGRNKIQHQKLKNWISENRIDVFHVLYTEPNILWFTYSDLGVLTVATTRGTDILVTILSFYNKRKINILANQVFKRYSRAFRNTSFITSTSNRQIETINKIFKRHDNIQLVRTGVIIENIKMKTLEVQKTHRNIVFMPRGMKQIYNHEFVIAAINKLPMRLKVDYTYVFIGNESNNKYASEIDRLLKTSSFNYQFLKTQSHEQMLNLYKQSILTIMTPKSDGTPVSALEAICSGSPVVFGPLDYDEDLFKYGSIRLKSWDENELSEKIQLSLDGKVEYNMGLAEERIKNKGNTIIEMRKILKIYNHRD